jgi:hypothetical protein
LIASTQKAVYTVLLSLHNIESLSSQFSLGNSDDQVVNRFAAGGQLAPYFSDEHITQFHFKLCSNLCLVFWAHSFNSKQLCFIREQRTPDIFLSWLANSLKLTYRIRYHALDRKVRKIVKNKYRYVRTYVCIREWHRVRLGIRLLVTATIIQSARHWDSRLSTVLSELSCNPERSLLRQLRRQHQHLALSSLGLT